MLKRPFFYLGLCAACIAVVTAYSQTTQITRPFGIAYSRNLRGGFVNFGNTNMHAVTNGVVDLVRMNESGNPANGFGLGYSQYGNDFSDMKLADIDDNASTLNSSSADLILPSGTNTIQYARLYWSGKMDIPTYNAVPDTLKKIKIRKGTSGAYTSLMASEVLSIPNLDQTGVIYQAYADITNFIQVNGAGTYTVADIPLTEVDMSGGPYGGWAISIAYENSALNYYSVRIYDGFSTIYNGGDVGSLGITLTGLNVPAVPIAAEDAVMGVVKWEGDANLLQDYIMINDNFVANATNPVNNFFNSSITKNGNYVTTKNPNYFNQMGIDIDELNVGVGYGIEPNDRTAEVLFGTERDQYFSGVFAFSVRIKDPTLIIDKIVTDDNSNGYVDAAEELTYTLSGTNIGEGNSYQTFIVDTIPANVTYVPGSFEVLSVPGGSTGLKTDSEGDDEFFVGTYNGKTYLKLFLGINASATAGGEVPVGTAGNYSVRFKVKALDTASNVINLAQIEGRSFADELFTDEDIAVIYVNYSRGITETFTACDGFTWKGTEYTNSGTYYYDYLNANGVTATDTLYLTINKSSNTRNVRSVCPSELPYTWDSLTFDAAGEKIFYYKNAAGCDSVVIFQLNVFDVVNSDTSVTLCERLLPYLWNGLTLNSSGTQKVTLKNVNGCDSLATLQLNVINCDPPCITENFNTNPNGWVLSNGARFTGYENPINNCTADRGIITPGVGGFDPAIIRTPPYTSSGAKRIKMSFDLFPFDANMRCKSWKNYNCPVSIDVNYYVAGVRYEGVKDYLLPPNGPEHSPNITLIFPVGDRLPEGTQYAIEIIFKFKNGVGQCVQQNTKYIIDNFSVCEQQCGSCPLPSSNVNGRFRMTSSSLKVWPNPASDIIHVVADDIPASIELLDMSGRSIQSLRYGKTIDVHHLLPGIYFMKIITADAKVEIKQIQILR
jgi:uncharacterized repeat protein (TIGR01451 family)